MLTIVVQGDELWDEEAEKFCYTEDTVLQFEHSLVSLSKWEAKYHKLFLTKEPKTEEEMGGYIQAMLLTPDVPIEVFDRMTKEQFEELDAYINDPMTGSTISEMPQGSRTSERLSSELIYFWMSQYNIDISHKHDHLNRLFTLIKIHHAKTQKPKKMSKNARAQQMAELNAQRKAQMGTKG